MKTASFDLEILPAITLIMAACFITYHLCDMVKILVRGYPPAPPAVPEEEEETDPIEG